MLTPLLTTPIKVERLAVSAGRSLSGVPIRLPNVVIYPNLMCQVQDKGSVHVMTDAGLVAISSWGFTTDVANILEGDIITKPDGAKCRVVAVSQFTEYIPHTEIMAKSGVV